MMAQVPAQPGYIPLTAPGVAATALATQNANVHRTTHTALSIFTQLNPQTRLTMLSTAEWEGAFFASLTDSRISVYDPIG